MKKILFVINTLGCGGAETALLSLLRVLDRPDCELHLLVLLGQGELAERLPDHVRLRNPRYSQASVLDGPGRRQLAKTVLRAVWAGGPVRQGAGILRNLLPMARRGEMALDKLLWRTISDGAPRFDEEFDLAAAWIEGGSAYYVADHVRAKRKIALVHIDYESAGYTRRMDQDCWQAFHRILAVSPETRAHFLAVYPEYAGKTEVLPNLIDQEGIRAKAREPGGFEDGFTGARLLTVGRLTRQKAIEVAIDALRLLKDAGCPARWYVLGEGDQRKALEKKIRALGLEEDFLLPGVVSNPYPYYAQADVYVHATRFEGRSIALQEAMTLGCPVVASDCGGNRSQITPGEDGLLCPLDPRALAETIARLLADRPLRERLGRSSAQKQAAGAGEVAAMFWAFAAGE